MCIEFYRRPIEERVVHALGKAWHVEVSLHIKNSEQVHHFFKMFVSCISRQFHINTGLFILFYFNYMYILQTDGIDKLVKFHEKSNLKP